MILLQAYALVLRSYLHICETPLGYTLIHIFSLNKDLSGSVRLKLARKKQQLVVSLIYNGTVQYGVVAD
jgi:hypothetical protein